MPSPFPGMDPFIECQVWDDFHGPFVADLADALVPMVRPKYAVRYERRVYVESDPEDPARYQTHEEAFLTIRERESLKVVTVVELLSPGNKRPGTQAIENTCASATPC